MGRKAQAAMEYVHTYGWVLLAVAMLSGILLYYNVSRAQTLLPLECTFLSGIRCLDSHVDEDLLSIVVVNEFGFTLSNISINMTGTCDSEANTSDGNPYGNLNVLLANQQAMYVFECQNLTNMRVTERIAMGYRNLNTGEAHMKVGKLEYSPTGQ
jgi:hypothetical protein